MATGHEGTTFTVLMACTLTQTSFFLQKRGFNSLPFCALAPDVRRNAGLSVVARVKVWESQSVVQVAKIPLHRRGMH
jgi:hypothetical protein